MGVLLFTSKNAQGVVYCRNRGNSLDTRWA